MKGAYFRGKAISAQSVTTGASLQNNAFAPNLTEFAHSLDYRTGDAPYPVAVLVTEMLVAPSGKIFVPVPSSIDIVTLAADGK
jgi:hypothetical protein